MRVLYDRVAAIDVHKDMAAPRGALLYSRFSREGFGGYSWVRWLTWRLMQNPLFYLLVRVARP